MIRPTLARLAALAIAVCAILPAAARPAAAEDGGALASAWAAAAAKDWAGADALAARSGPIAVDLVLWRRLRAEAERAAASPVERLLDDVLLLQNAPMSSEERKRQVRGL